MLIWSELVILLPWLRLLKVILLTFYSLNYDCKREIWDLWDGFVNSEDFLWNDFVDSEDFKNGVFAKEILSKTYKILFTKCSLWII